MPIVPFLSPIDTYQNYQRPRGLLEVLAANTAISLGTDELLQRFLTKNLKVSLDFGPCNGRAYSINFC